MNQSKRSKTSGDRLSELPDSLIFDIFQFLPLTDVVRTELLSKRYENLWKTVPFLNFVGFKKKTNTQGIQKFIAWAVMLWKGSKILKLKIDFGTRLNKSLHGEIDFLVRFAKNFEVEELSIHLKYACNITQDDDDDDDEKLYGVPQCLYSCSSIKSLHLKGCNLRTPERNVCWNQLEYLRIEAYVLCQDSVDKVLRGSPKLESLMLRFKESHDNLSIQSSSLTYLQIYKYLYYEDDEPSGATELRISTPNLQRLKIAGLPYSKFFMNNVVPLLTRASLDDCGHDLFSGDDFVGETVKQILPKIRNVKQLGLSDWYIKALGDMKNKNILSPFRNVKKLRLCSRLEEYEKAARVLELFPQLQQLVLEYDKSSKRRKGKPAKFEADFPNSFLQKLRTIKAIWTKGENSIFRLIEILLKYASKLEMMDFRSSNSQFLQSAEEKVVRMPRSSQNAVFIFCEK